MNRLDKLKENLVSRIDKINLITYEDLMNKIRSEVVDQMFEAWLEGTKYGNGLLSSVEIDIDESRKKFNAWLREKL